MPVLNSKDLNDIFHQPLNEMEASRLHSLVKNANHNKAFTQQLALDASKLLTISEERLDGINDSGFIKRCWNSFTGENRNIRNRNNEDLLKMQHFSWNYLKELQSQNLINSYSVATIINNLTATNDILYETRGFLEKVVDKVKDIDNRLALSEWALNIKVNKRRFKSYPKTILVLYVILDFIKSNKDIQFSRKDMNYIMVLLDEMGVDFDKELRFIDFIIDLINDIEIIKVDNYRELIDLSFEDHYVDNRFIEDNISGSFFNTLYFLSENYNRIHEIVSDNTICDTDEKFEKIVFKFFSEDFDFLESKYTIREIAEEIVGSSVLTINLYKEQNGLYETEEDGFNEEEVYSGDFKSSQGEHIEENTSFNELIVNLELSSISATLLRFRNFEISMKSNEYSFYSDDSVFGFNKSIFSKVVSSIGGSATALGRSSCTSDLNDYKKEVSEYISDKEYYLTQANSIIANYNLEKIAFESHIGYSDIDLDTSATNDDWHDQFNYILDQIEKSIDSFTDACDNAVQQLELFKNNEYDKSVIQMQRQAEEDHKNKINAERESKKTVTISDNIEVSIDWQIVKNLPIHPEDIHTIESFNNKWIVLGKDTNVYLSNNGEDWHTLDMCEVNGIVYISTIKIIDDTCILFHNDYEKNGFTYSSDGENWYIGNIPKGVDYFDGLYPTESIVKLDDIWLWLFTERTEYSYTEKGFFTNLNKKGDYKKAVLMYASGLDGRWEKWEHSPSLNEGLEIEKFSILPNSNIPILLAEYNWMYKDHKKKVDAVPMAIYLSDNYRWRNCNWEFDSIRSDSSFNKIKDFYYYHDSFGGSFKSKNGFEWEKADMDFSADNSLNFNSLYIFTSYNKLHILTDVAEAHEMILEDGNWRDFSINGSKILAIHSPSHHEKNLMLGSINIRDLISN